MTIDNVSGPAVFRRAVQAPVRRAADEFRRLADALDAAAAEVDVLDRGLGPHPAVDLARTVIQQIQAVGGQVDYGTLLRAAADLDAVLIGAPLAAPPPAASGRFSRRAAQAPPPPAPAPVNPISPNTLWVEDDQDAGRVRFVWVTGLDAKAVQADCRAWRDETNVRVRPTTIPVAQFQPGIYRPANEQEYRRAAQIIVALRSTGVDVSVMRPLLEFAKRS
ncbi:hypothetical protein [Kutzneria kofuensis]|uniref:Uncharacterized protein n=1 Tax=Kutzneria kofuensis TaxID=103725 RepID=A0A7W9KSQ0_9PSEU|nr:hypothetical protein [Kutzneria kofuensis]MBB5897214.1 hypothetical protein [Kutzneria kofuensis]